MRVLLIHEDDLVFGCHVDHIIAEKHGGATVLENLAFACGPCNRAKGSDIASLTRSGRLTRLFNPRTDRWSMHFVLRGSVILPKTDIGDVTVRLLEFNAPRRLAEREVLIRINAYPPREAISLLS